MVHISEVLRQQARENESLIKEKWDAVITLDQQLQTNIERMNPTCAVTFEDLFNTNIGIKKTFKIHTVYSSPPTITFLINKNILRVSYVTTDPTFLEEAKTNVAEYLLSFAKLFNIKTIVSNQTAKAFLENLPGNYPMHILESRFASLAYKEHLGIGDVAFVDTKGHFMQNYLEAFSLLKSKLDYYADTITLFKYDLSTGFEEIYAEYLYKGFDGMMRLRNKDGIWELVGLNRLVKTRISIDFKMKSIEEIPETLDKILEWSSEQVKMIHLIDPPKHYFKKILTQQFLIFSETIANQIHDQFLKFYDCYELEEWMCKLSKMTTPIQNIRHESVRIYHILNKFLIVEEEKEEVILTDSFDDAKSLFQQYVKEEMDRKYAKMNIFLDTALDELAKWKESKFTS